MVARPGLKSKEQSKKQNNVTRHKCLKTVRRVNLMLCAEEAGERQDLEALREEENDRLRTQLQGNNTVSLENQKTNHVKRKWLLG